MRLSGRSLRIGLSLLGVAAMVGALAVVLVPSGLLSHAAPKAVTATYTGKAGAATRVTSTSSAPTHPGATTSKAKYPLALIQLRVPGGKGASAKTVSGSIPHTNGILNGVSQGTLLHNFNALSDLDQANANGGQGFEVTPPDQGLCAGNDPFLSGHPRVVWEAINSAVAEYSTSGTLLAGPFSFAQFFEPNAFSDPRCFYDTSTNTFFFTVISSASFGGLNDTFNDVVVLNSHGAALYMFDSTDGGNCFGDQPKAGYDAHAFYLSTDQFCTTGYLGELLLAVNKSELVNESSTVHFVSFGNPNPLTIGGIAVLGQEPAFGGNTGTEYLLNSFPFDAFGNSNSIDNQLGFWKVTGDQNINSGVVTLSGKIITSETYAFPTPAQSNGTGTSTCVPFFVAVNCTSGILVRSESFLNPDDDRMLQVQLVNDAHHGLQLYASLSTALTIGHDPSDRDGAAWFVLDPTQAKITSQGYVGVAGAYLLYPAILHTHNGTTAIAFTLTSPTISPRADYVFQSSTSSSFSSVKTVATGSGPHLSFADDLGQVRWGDYSACELDPGGNDLWCATEYIPLLSHQDPIDNWGTRIWDIAGSTVQ